MGIFRQFPYSNFHDMNMDQIIKIVREMLDEWVEYKAKLDTLYSDITKAFDEYGVNWEVVKLDSGDYSAILPEDEEMGIPEIDLRDEICIERKMSCDEIIGNLTRNKERFHKEFGRTNADIPILIEDDFSNACRGNYKSQVTPKQFLGALFSFCDKYGTFFYFMKDKELSAIWIYDIFKYRIRNKLKEIE